MMRFIVFITLFVAVDALAQEFTGKAELPIVNEDGFYKVEIHPDIAALLTDSYANLRIAGPDGQFVPYFLESDHEYAYREFAPYHIRRNDQRQGCCTELVLENPSGGSISNLHLKIRNADVRKKASLSGSDDGINWFVLKETIVFTSINSVSETSEVRVVDFPLSDYRFYKLWISDSVSAPLNIVEAGYYRHFVRDGVYTPLQHHRVVINQDVDRKRTVITVSFDTIQWVDRIIVKATGFPLFDREATIQSVEPTTNKKKTSTSFVTRFRVTHQGPAIVDTEGLKTATFQIAIENGDNPPLNYDPVSVHHLTRFLVTHLRAGARYELKIGPETMATPRYDLEKFEDEVSNDVSVVRPGPVVFSRNHDEQPSTFFTREIMWFGIVAIILVLGFLSYRMVKDGRMTSK